MHPIHITIHIRHFFSPGFYSIYVSNGKMKAIPIGNIHQSLITCMCCKKIREFKHCVLPYFFVVTRIILKLYTIILSLAGFSH